MVCRLRPAIAIEPARSDQRAKKRPAERDVFFPVFVYIFAVPEVTGLRNGSATHRNRRTIRRNRRNSPAQIRIYTDEDRTSSAPEGTGATSAMPAR